MTENIATQTAPDNPAESLGYWFDVPGRHYLEADSYEAAAALFVGIALSGNGPSNRIGIPRGRWSQVIILDHGLKGDVDDMIAAWLRQNTEAGWGIKKIEPGVYQGRYGKTLSIYHEFHPLPDDPKALVLALTMPDDPESLATFPGTVVIFGEAAPAGAIRWRLSGPNGLGGAKLRSTRGGNINLSAHRLPVTAEAPDHAPPKTALYFTRTANDADAVTADRKFYQPLICNRLCEIAGKEKHKRELFWLSELIGPWLGRTWPSNPQIDTLIRNNPGLASFLGITVPKPRHKVGEIIRKHKLASGRWVSVHGGWDVMIEKPRPRRETFVRFRKTPAEASAA